MQTPDSSPVGSARTRSRSAITPVALLTASSNGTKYSLRSAAAAACVATHSPAQFYAFNHDLLDDQPEVGSDGLSDEDLANLAGAVGVDNAKAVRSCIEDGDFVGWAKEATTRALDGPLAGSDDLVLTAAPMIVANGEAYVGALGRPGRVLAVRAQRRERCLACDVDAFAHHDPVGSKPGRCHR